MIQPNEPFWLGPEDTDKACLFIHGFMGRPSEIRGLAETLAQHGIRCYGVLVAGHSGDPEDLLHVGRREWIASAEAGLAQLARYPSVFIAGFSMGGALALLLASRYPQRIAGVVAMSTPTRLSAAGWQENLLPLLPLVRRLIRWFYPLSFVNLRDPKAQAEVLKQAQMRIPGISIDFSDPQTIAHLKQIVRIPVSAIDELVQLTKVERHSLGEVRSPLLIIHSKRDQVVSPACAYELYRLTIAASPKSLHWLEQSDHVITLGPECEEIDRLVLSFIASITPTAPNAATSAQPGAAHRNEEGGTPLDR